MKKIKILPLLAVMAILFSWTTPANAELLSRLGGAAVYDTDLDITWVSDANLAATITFGVPGISTSPGSIGAMTWDTGKEWIAAMNGANYLGFTDWRLPSMDVNGDTTVVRCRSSTQAACLDNEMGYLYYQNMGGTFGSDLSGNQAPFTNIVRFYWSTTDWAPNPSVNVWGFGFNNGLEEGQIPKDSPPPGAFVWAVRDGDPAATAKALNETAVTELTAIVTAIQADAPNVGDIEKASKRLNEAKGSLLASLNSFQTTDPNRLIVDPLLPDGTAFFGHSKDAVKKIFKAIEDGEITNPTLLIQLQNVVVGKVLKATKTVAQVAINDATNAVGSTNADVIRAQIDLETGNQLTNNGINVGISALAFFDETVKSYGHAWEFAQQAVEALPAE